MGICRIILLHQPIPRDLFSRPLSETFATNTVRLKQTNPADFTSAFIYIQAMRILSDYPFKLQSRRFVQDLFDKFSWDIAALNTLLKYQGLNMSTPIVTTYKVNLAPIEPEKKVESNPITLSVQNLSFQQFPPAKIKKGFVV